MNLKGTSLYEFKRGAARIEKVSEMTLYEFKWDPAPGRGLDIKQGPESVPLFGAEGGPLSD